MKRRTDNDVNCSGLDDLLRTAADEHRGGGLSHDARRRIVAGAMAAGAAKRTPGSESREWAWGWNWNWNWAMGAAATCAIVGLVVFNVFHVAESVAPQVVARAAEVSESAPTLVEKDARPESAEAPTIVVGANDSADNAAAPPPVVEEEFKLRPLSEVAAAWNARPRPPARYRRRFSGPPVGLGRMPAISRVSISAYLIPAAAPVEELEFDSVDRGKSGADS